MKVHAGVDAGTGFVHTITGTAANVHDSRQISELIRNDDEVVYGDSGYLGAADQEAIKSNENFSKIEFRINKRPSSLRLRIAMRVRIGINVSSAANHPCEAKWNIHTSSSNVISDIGR